MAFLESLFSNKKKKSYLVGLLLKLENGVVMVFEKNEDEIILKAKEKFDYVDGFENLTKIVDEILFKLENKLQVQTSEIIFFLYSHFLDEKTGEVKKDVLVKIKNLAKELNLKPLGYVEVAEVLSTYFSHEEKIPFTALMLEFDCDFLTLFVYKGGKIFLKKTISLSNDVVSDILSILNEKRDDFLIPTRLIIYNSKTIEDYFLKIIHHQWPEKIFIQSPKVEILKEEDLFNSLTYILNQQLINGKSYTEKIYEKEEKDLGFGFVIGKDVAEIEREVKKDSNKDASRSTLLQKEKINFSQLISKFLKDKLTKFLIFFKGINNFFNNKILKNKILNKLGLLFLLMFIFGLFLINEYFFHKAKITIYLPTKQVKETVDLDLEYFISTFSATIKDEKEVSGVKTIGEKASGDVIVYNTNLNKEKIIKKGTEVENGGLKFVFSEDVIVASASSATSPGKATTKLIAAEIGEEYNLSKGKKFNIDDNSYAESLSDFKGGSKKQIKVVSQKDIEELEDKILQKGQKIKNLKIDSKKISLPNLRKIKIEKKQLNKEIGEEASIISYQATLAITDFYVNKDQLIKKLTEKLKKEELKNYVIDKAGLNYQIKDYKLNQKTIDLEVVTQANFIKNLNAEGLINEIKGKTKNYLDKVLKTKYNTMGYELEVKSFLPVFNYFLPLFKNNIEINFSRY